MTTPPPEPPSGGGYPPPPPPPPPPPGPPPGVPGGAAAVPQQNQKAMISMILGIVGLCCCGLIGIVAIVLSLQAKKEIEQSGGQQSGAGMAQAGLILGIIAVVLIVVQVPLAFSNF